MTDDALPAEFCPACGAALETVEDTLRAKRCPDHGRLMLNVTRLPGQEGEP